MDFTGKIIAITRAKGGVSKVGNEMEVPGICD